MSRFGHEYMHGRIKRAHGTAHALPQSLRRNCLPQVAVGRPPACWQRALAPGLDMAEPQQSPGHLLAEPCKMTGIKAHCNPDAIQTKGDAGDLQGRQDGTETIADGLQNGRKELQGGLRVRIHQTCTPCTSEISGYGSSRFNQIPAALHPINTPNHTRHLLMAQPG